MTMKIAKYFELIGKKKKNTNLLDIGSIHILTLVRVTKVLYMLCDKLQNYTSLWWDTVIALQSRRGLKRHTHGI